MMDGSWFSVSEKVKQSLRCELDVSYGPDDNEKYDIITSHSALQGAIRLAVCLFRNKFR